MNHTHTLYIACTLLFAVNTLVPSHSLAQQGVRQFDQLSIKEVKPEDLGGGVDLENPADLLKVNPEQARVEISEDEQAALTKKMRAHVVQVVALYMPPEPYEQTPMIYRGHGVWIRKDAKSAPVLVSTLSWLKDAKEIYLAPTTTPSKKTQAHSAHTSTLADLSTGRSALRAFNKEKKNLIKLDVLTTNSMRGLIALSLPKKTKKNYTPPTGLLVLPKAHKGFTYLFGYSTEYPDALTPSGLLPQKAKEEEYTFFFQTNYQGILGAPLIDEEAHVVVLNAIRHPLTPELSLAIPPGAIQNFLMSLKDTTSP